MVVESMYSRLYQGISSFIQHNQWDIFLIVYIRSPIQCVI
jgi:hypothetical protein